MGRNAHEVATEAAQCVPSSVNSNASSEQVDSDHSFISAHFHILALPHDFFGVSAHFGGDRSVVSHGTNRVGIQGIIFMFLYDLLFDMVVFVGVCFFVGHV